MIRNPEKEVFMSKAIFQRQLRANIAHFSRYMNKAAPVTRTLEISFETNQDHSDAMSACLMLNESIRPALDKWNVFENDTWKRSAERHAGKTVSQIINETFPA